MEFQNTGKRGIYVDGKWISPGEKTEVSEDLDLKRISGSFRVFGKKLEEPAKGLKKKIKEEDKYGE